jgi:hypothetical protein
MSDDLDSTVSAANRCDICCPSLGISWPHKPSDMKRKDRLSLTDVQNDDILELRPRKLRLMRDLTKVTSNFKLLET